MKKFTLLLCGIVLCAAITKAQTWNIGAEGNGSNVTATPNGATLVVTGAGAIHNYDPGGPNVPPWVGYQMQYTAVEFGEGITHIGSALCFAWPNLTSVSLPSTLTSIGNQAFQTCDKLSSIHIPDAVTTIGHVVFNGCAALETVTGGKGIVSFGEAAFVNCSSLTAFTISSTATTFGESVFHGCTSLAEIVNEAAVPQTINANVFNNVPKATCVLKVPAESVELYEAASVWTDFENIEAISGGDPCDNPIAEGTTGALAWKLCSDGLLTITGNGAMPDYQTYNSSPWYAHRESITAIKIGEGVTHLGIFAFYNCSGVTGAELPESLTSIGDGAFNWCSGLTSILIPDAVTTIAEYAFFGCTGLTSVTIGSSTETIGESAFENCAALVEITNRAAAPQTINDAELLEVNKATCVLRVPAGSIAAYQAANVWKDFTNIEAISGGDPCDNPIAEGTTGDLAWKLCSDGMLTITGSGAMPDFDLVLTPWNDHKTSITGVTVGDGITSIGKYAFAQCSNIAAVTFPESLTSIGEAAFVNCSGLTSIDIPASVTHIYDYVFNNCSGLMSLTLPNGVGYIGIQAFGGCTAMTSVTIPASLTGIAALAFNNCTALAEITNYALMPQPLNANVFNNVNKTTCVLRVPADAVDEYEAADVWKDFLNIEAIDDCDTPIAEGTIDNLTWVVCPNGKLAIDGTGIIPDYEPTNSPWYSYINGVTEIVIGNGVTRIGNHAFQYGNFVTAITIGEGVETIGEYAFSSCSRTASITIPNSVTAIGAYAFANCFGMESVTIGNSVTIIGHHAFDGCTKLEAAIIPNSVTAIENNAFYGCLAMLSVSIPESVTAIGDYVFEGCNALATIEVAANNPSYSSAGNVLFNKNKTELLLCARAKTGEYTAPQSVTVIGTSAFSMCTGLTSVTLGDAVEVIKEYGFYYCSGLTEFTTPNSVTEIQQSAFYGCTGLTSITIGSAVTTLGKFALAYSTNLAEIINRAVTPQTILGNVVNGINKNTCVLKVPAESVELYEAADVWKDFVNIEGIAIDPCDNPIAEGTTGALTWKICADGLLSITGNGAMPDYGYNGTPWNAHLEAITGITIGEGVTRVGVYSFFNCQEATSVTLPSTVTSIGNYAFRYTSGVTSVTIPAAVVAIGDYAFANSGLTSVNIPAATTIIGLSAFNFCFDLTSIEADAANTGFSSVEGVLFNKSQTQLIQCPGGKTGEYAIPGSVITVKEWSFFGSALTTITVPNSVTAIGTYALAHCRALTGIYVEEGNPNFASEGGVLFNADKTDLIQYPSGKTGAYVIPEGTVSTKGEAFAYCLGLTSVTIPESLTSIGGYIFTECTALTEVINYAVVPQDITVDEFSQVNLAACTLRVPEESLNAYHSAEGWKEFGNIEAIGVGIHNNTLTGITVYGNQNNIHIVNPGNINLKLVQVIDVSGRVVYTGNASGSAIVPVNGASGIYMVRLIADNNRVLSAKVHLN